MKEIRDMMQTNVYSFAGTVLIMGSCLPEVAPAAFAELAETADQVYRLCLEQTHVNMAITKLTAILGTGQVTRLFFASVDRSPHCTQLHYIRHEIERVLPEHIPMESFVLEDGAMLPIPEAAVELSKSLAALSRLV